VLTPVEGIQCLPEFWQYFIIRTERICEAAMLDRFFIVLLGGNSRIDAGRGGPAFRCREAFGEWVNDLLWAQI
jgi:hypothetical protein